MAINIANFFIITVDFSQRKNRQTKPALAALYKACMSKKKDPFFNRSSIKYS